MDKLDRINDIESFDEWARELNYISKVDDINEFDEDKKAESLRWEKLI